MRVRSFTSVLLPAPFAPTTAVTLPAGNSATASASTASLLSG
jgi:hypothetical protein